MCGLHMIQQLGPLPPPSLCSDWAFCLCHCYDVGVPFGDFNPTICACALTWTPGEFELPRSILQNTLALHLVVLLQGYRDGAAIPRGWGDAHQADTQWQKASCKPANTLPFNPLSRPHVQSYLSSPSVLYSVHFSENVSNLRKRCAVLYVGIISFAASSGTIPSAYPR